MVEITFSGPAQLDIDFAETPDFDISLLPDHLLGQHTDFDASDTTVGYVITRQADGSYAMEAGGGGGGGAGSDTTAIHDDTAAEISAITLKATPVSGDFLVIEDSAAANAKRRITVGSLPTAGGGETNTASNTGVGGQGLFARKTGFDLEFFNIQDTTSIAATLDAGNDEIDLTVLPAGVDHDLLLNRVADQHVLHAGVSVIAGVGLTGGGTISLSRTLDLDTSTLTAITGNAAAGDHFSVYDITAGAMRRITLANLEGDFTHDNLAGVTADEHIAHSGVTLTAGAGLGGGGTIAANRTFILDIGTLTATTAAAAADEVAIDNAISGTRRLTFANFEANLNHDSLAGFVLGEHFLEGSIDHTAIANIGTNSHGAIDTHIAATATHGATGAVVGTTNTQTLTNKTLTTPTINGVVATTGLTLPAHTLGGDWTRAANQTLNLTGGVDRGLLLRNGGSGTAYLDADGDLLFRGGTAFAVTLTGTPTADRTWTFPDATDTVVGQSRLVSTATGLTGGGSLAADRTIDYDVAALTAVAGANGDSVLLYDAGAGGHRRVLWENLPGGGGGSGNTLDAAYDQGGAGLGRIIDAEDSPVVIRDLTVLVSDTGTALFNCNHDVTADLGAGWTGQEVQFRTDRTLDTARSTADDYDNVLIQRIAGTSILSSTLTSAGALLKLENSVSATVGTTTDSAILIEGSARSAADPALRFYVAAETTARWACDVDGLMTWGPGASGATDTTLERTGVGILDLANILDVNTGIRVAGAAASGNYLRGDGANFISAALNVGDATAGTLAIARGGTGRTTARTLTKSATIYDPVATDDSTLFRAPVACTVSSTDSHITGTTNVVYNIYHASARNGTGLVVFSSNITETSVAGVNHGTPGGDVTIPAGNYVWVEIVSVSGTPTRFHVTLNFTED